MDFSDSTPAALDEHGRPEPPLQAGEADTTLGFLDFLRGTVAWKCDGLDAAELATTAPPSSMTLGGLLKHLTFVEDIWCSRRLHGNPPAPPWDTVDWDGDEDWDWHSAALDPPEELRAGWAAAVDRSRALVAVALSDGGLDRMAVWVDASCGVAPNLRYILVHLIEEYARHAGHADLLREAIDGLTGE